MPALIFPAPGYSAVANSSILSTATWYSSDSLGSVGKLKTQSTIAASTIKLDVSKVSLARKLITNPINFTPNVIKKGFQTKSVDSTVLTTSTNRLESTINTTTFVYTQTSVSTTVNPITARERLYYAQLVPGRYGQTLTYNDKISIMVSSQLKTNVLSKPISILRPDTSSRTSVSLLTKPITILRPDNIRISNTSTVIPLVNKMVFGNKLISNKIFDIPSVAKTKTVISLRSDSRRSIGAENTNTTFNRLESTINTTTFVYTQTAVTTLVSPTTARERLYYAQLVPGRYGQAYPYIALSQGVLTSVSGKISSVNKLIAMSSVVSRATLQKPLVSLRPDSSYPSKIYVGTDTTQIFYDTTIENVIQVTATALSGISDTNNLVDWLDDNADILTITNSSPAVQLLTIYIDRNSIVNPQPVVQITMQQVPEGLSLTTTASVVSYTANSITVVDPGTVASPLDTKILLYWTTARSVITTTLSSNDTNKTSLVNKAIFGKKIPRAYTTVTFRTVTTDIVIPITGSSGSTADTVSWYINDQDILTVIPQGSQLVTLYFAKIIYPITSTIILSSSVTGYNRKVSVISNTDGSITFTDPGDLPSISSLSMIISISKNIIDYSTITYLDSSTEIFDTPQSSNLPISPIKLRSDNIRPQTVNTVKTIAKLLATTSIDVRANLQKPIVSLKSDNNQIFYNTSTQISVVNKAVFGKKYSTFTYLDGSSRIFNIPGPYKLSRVTSLKTDNLRILAVGKTNITARLIDKPIINASGNLQKSIVSLKSDNNQKVTQVSLVNKAIFGKKLLRAYTTATTRIATINIAIPVTGISGSTANTVNWYVNDQDILTVIPVGSPLVTLYFAKSPYLLGDSITIVNLNIGYSKTVSVIASTDGSVTVVDPGDLLSVSGISIVISSTQSVVDYVTNTYVDSGTQMFDVPGVSKLSRAITLKSDPAQIRTIGKTKIISKLVPSIGVGIPLSLQKQFAILKADNNQRTSTYTTATQAPLINKVTFGSRISRAYTTSTTQTISVDTVISVTGRSGSTADTVSWYINDQDILTVIPLGSSLITLYFAKQPQLYFVPGSSVKIFNNVIGYSKQITVISSTDGSITFTDPEDIPSISGLKIIYTETQTVFRSVTNTVLENGIEIFNVPTSSNLTKSLTILKADSTATKASGLLNKPIVSLRDGPPLIPTPGKVTSSLVLRPDNNQRSGVYNTATQISIVNKVTFGGRFTRAYTTVTTTTIYLDTPWPITGRSGSTADTANWYIYDQDILTTTNISGSTVTLYFAQQNLQTLASGIQVRLVNWSVGYTKLVTLITATNASITFTDPGDLPSISGLNILLSVAQTVTDSKTTTYLDSSNKIFDIPTSSTLIRSSKVSKLVAGPSIGIPANLQKPVTTLKADNNQKSSTYNTATQISVVNKAIFGKKIPRAYTTSTLNLVTTDVQIPVIGRTGSTADTVSWYINDQDILTVIPLGSALVTFYFAKPADNVIINNSSIKIINLNIGYSKQVSVISKTANSVTFADPGDLPSISNMFIIGVTSQYVVNYSTVTYLDSSTEIFYTPASGNANIRSVKQQSLSDTVRIQTPGKASSVSKLIAGTNITTSANLQKQFAILKADNNQRTAAYSTTTQTPLIAKAIFGKKYTRAYTTATTRTVTSDILTPITGISGSTADTVSWYINDQDILTVIPLGSALVTFYFVKSSYTITGMIKLINTNIGYSKLISVISSTDGSITFVNPGDLPSISGMYIVTSTTQSVIDYQTYAYLDSGSQMFDVPRVSKLSTITQLKSDLARVQTVGKTTVVNRLLGKTAPGTSGNLQKQTTIIKGDNNQRTSTYSTATQISLVNKVTFGGRIPTAYTSSTTKIIYVVTPWPITGRNGSTADTVNWYIYDQDILNTAQSQDSSVTLYFAKQTLQNLTVGNQVRLINWISGYTKQVILTSATESSITFVDPGDLPSISGLSILLSIPQTVVDNTSITQFESSNKLVNTPKSGNLSKSSIILKADLTSAKSGLLNKSLVKLISGPSIAVRPGKVTSAIVVRPDGNQRSSLYTTATGITLVNKAIFGKSSTRAYTTATTRTITVDSQIPVISRAESTADTVSWYINDQDILTVIPTGSLLVTLYFATAQLGSNIRILNVNIGYSKSISVVNITNNSITFTDPGDLPSISGMYIVSSTTQNIVDYVTYTYIDSSSQIFDVPRISKLSAITRLKSDLARVQTPGRVATVNKLLGKTAPGTSGNLQKQTAIIKGDNNQRTGTYSTTTQISIVNKVIFGGRIPRSYTTSTTKIIYVDTPWPVTGRSGSIADTVNWYIYDQDILNTSQSQESEVTLYFAQQNLQTLSAGLQIRLLNWTVGYTRLVTLTAATNASITFVDPGDLPSISGLSILLSVPQTVVDNTSITQFESSNELISTPKSGNLAKALIVLKAESTATKMSGLINKNLVKLVDTAPLLPRLGKVKSAIVLRPDNNQRSSLYTTATGITLINKAIFGKSSGTGSQIFDVPRISKLLKAISVKADTAQIRTVGKAKTISKLTAGTSVGIPFNLQKQLTVLKADANQRSTLYTTSTGITLVNKAKFGTYIPRPYTSSVTRTVYVDTPWPITGRDGSTADTVNYYIYDQDILNTVQSQGATVTLYFAQQNLQTLSAGLQIRLISWTIGYTKLVTLIDATNSSITFADPGDLPSISGLSILLSVPSTITDFQTTVALESGSEMFSTPKSSNLVKSSLTVRAIPTVFQTSATVSKNLVKLASAVNVSGLAKLTRATLVKGIPFTASTVTNIPLVNKAIFGKRVPQAYTSATIKTIYTDVQLPVTGITGSTADTVNWYINDQDILTVIPIGSALVTLYFARQNQNYFSVGSQVRVFNGNIGYNQLVTLTSFTDGSITFVNPGDLPSISGMYVIVTQSQNVIDYITVSNLDYSTSIFSIPTVNSLIKSQIQIRSPRTISTAYTLTNTANRLESTVNTTTFVYTQTSVSTTLAPITARERLYYAQVAPGRYGKIITYNGSSVAPGGILSTATNRLESTVNATTFVYTQTSVTTTLAPTNARERLYYAQLAAGKYGITLTYNGRSIAPGGILSTATNRLESTVNTTTFVYTQTSVTTTLAPISARERLYYAQLAAGKYGITVTYNGRPLSGGLNVPATDALQQRTRDNRFYGIAPIEVNRNLEFFNDVNLTGEISFPVRYQLPTVLTTSNSIAVYIYDYDILTYSTYQNPLRKLVLSYNSVTAPSTTSTNTRSIPFAVGSTVKIYSKKLGYINTFTVLESNYDTITVSNISSIPLLGDTDDLTITGLPSVYPIASVSTNTAPTTARENLYYFNLSPGLRSGKNLTVGEASRISNAAKLTSSLVVKALPNNLSASVTSRVPIKLKSDTISLTANKLTQATKLKTDSSIIRSSNLELIYFVDYFSSSTVTTSTFVVPTASIQINRDPQNPREALYYALMGPGIKGRGVTLTAFGKQTVDTSSKLLVNNLNKNISQLKADSATIIIGKTTIPLRLIYSPSAVSSGNLRSIRPILVAGQYDNKIPLVTKTIFGKNNTAKIFESPSSNNLIKSAIKLRSDTTKLQTISGKILPLKLADGPPNISNSLANLQKSLIQLRPDSSYSSPTYTSTSTTSVIYDSYSVAVIGSDLSTANTVDWYIDDRDILTVIPTVLSLITLYFRPGQNIVDGNSLQIVQSNIGYTRTITDFSYTNSSITFADPGDLPSISGMTINWTSSRTTITASAIGQNINKIPLVTKALFGKKLPQARVSSVIRTINVDTALPVISRSGSTANTVDWYINDQDILTTTSSNSGVVTLYFAAQPVQTFTASGQVRLANYSVGYIKQLTIISATNSSITINDPGDLPSSLNILISTPQYISDFVTSTYLDNSTEIFESPISSNLVKSSIKLRPDAAKLQTIPGRVPLKVTDGPPNISRSLANLQKPLIQLRSDSATAIGQNLNKISLVTKALFGKKLPQARVASVTKIINIDVPITVTAISRTGSTANTVDWYINDNDILTTGVTTDNLITLFFDRQNLQIFSAGDAIRLADYNLGYIKQVTLVSATPISVTFVDPEDLFSSSNNLKIIVGSAQTVTDFQTTTYLDNNTKIFESPASNNLIKSSIKLRPDAAKLQTLSGKILPLKLTGSIPLIVSPGKVTSTAVLRPDSSYSSPSYTSTSTTSVIYDSYYVLVTGSSETGVTTDAVSWYIDDKDILTVIPSGSKALTLFFDPIQDSLSGLTVTISQGSTNYYRVITNFTSTRSSITFPNPGDIFSTSGMIMSWTKPRTTVTATAIGQDINKIPLVNKAIFGKKLPQPRTTAVTRTIYVDNLLPVIGRSGSTADTVNWYIYDQDILNTSSSVDSTVTLYLAKQNLQIFTAGSQVRVANYLIGYVRQFTVISATDNSVTFNDPGDLPSTSGLNVIVSVAQTINDFQTSTYLDNSTEIFESPISSNLVKSSIKLRSDAAKLQTMPGKIPFKVTDGPPNISKSLANLQKSLIQLRPDSSYSSPTYTSTSTSSVTYDNYSVTVIGSDLSTANTVDWYIEDRDVLTVFPAGSSLVTLYFIPGFDSVAGAVLQLIQSGYTRTITSFTYTSSSITFLNPGDLPSIFGMTINWARPKTTITAAAIGRDINKIPLVNKAIFGKKLPQPRTVAVTNTIYVDNPIPVIGISRPTSSANTVAWYIEDRDILTTTSAANSTITLIFAKQSLKQFTAGEQIRLADYALNYVKQVTIISATDTSVTFADPGDLVTTTSINILVSVAQSVTDSQTTTYLDSSIEIFDTPKISNLSKQTTQVKAEPAVFKTIGQAKLPQLKLIPTSEIFAKPAKLLTFAILKADRSNLIAANLSTRKTTIGKLTDDVSIKLVLGRGQIVKLHTGNFKLGSVGIQDPAAQKKEPIQFWN
jgi:hypothetical protein